MKESKFQHELILELNDRFPGCVILKNDPTYKQGIPDLLILYNDNWGMLEVKQSPSAHHQPNQDYYINMLNGMSYASFICPENKEDVLNALERALRS